MILFSFSLKSIFKALIFSKIISNEKKHLLTILFLTIPIFFILSKINSFIHNKLIPEKILINKKIFLFKKNIVSNNNTAIIISEIIIIISFIIIFNLSVSYIINLINSLLFSFKYSE